MSTLHPIRGRRTNEELFFEHYSKILGWASQMSHQDKADADDLVQDFYIQVAKMNTRLAEVDEIEPYLFKILRNLHYSRLRQKGRSPIYELSVVDYDSLERSLAAVDRHGLLLVRAQLRSICEFVCERKNTARSASLFILRFFFGYYPSEVIKLTLTKRAAVDKSLQLAREEAQAFIDRGGDARPSGAREKRGLLGEVGDGSSHDLFSELRQTIFASRQGACFSAQGLEKRYQSPSQFQAPQRFTVQELAHLVSCRSCLERANATLGLPRLDQRSPDETIGRDNPPGGGSEPPKLSVSKGGKRETGRKDHRALERRMREFFEHRPAGLEICVDGDSRAAQPVNAEVTEFYFRLNRAETPEFLEVFSEQCIRLAYLHVREPASYPGLEQRQVVTLSDGRSLELTVSFAKELPTVHVVYRDPVFAQISALDVESDSCTGMAVIRNNRYEVSADERGIALFEPSPRFSRVRTGLAALRAWVRGLRSASPSSQHNAAEPSGISFADSEMASPPRRQSWLRRVLDRMTSMALPEMNPMFATALVCAVAALVFLFLSYRTSSVMKPRDFLARSASAEHAPEKSGTAGVIVQTVRMRTPQRTLERTLYRDIQGKRHAKETAPSREEAALRSQLESAGVRWNDPLSADAFREWHDRSDVRQDVVKETEKGLLTLTTVVSDGAVSRETLTVRASDFHPVERTVELRDAGTVEVAELNYSVLPWNSVNPDLFDPLAAAPPAMRGGMRGAAPLHLPALPSEIQMDEAELAVRLVLNQLHLDSNGRIELSRGADGIHVQGVVETDEEKRQLQTQLHMVPHVVPSILTVREMAALPSAASDITSIEQSSVVEAQPSALEKYVVERGMDRAAMSAASQEFVESSFVVKHESEQIAALLSRFSANESLTVQARTSLSELLIQHKASLLAALAREDRELAALQLLPHPAEAPESASGTPDGLRSTAEQNFALCVELLSGSDASSRSAQTIGPQLATSIAQLRAVALHISAAAQMNPSSATNANAKQNQ